MPSSTTHSLLLLLFSLSSTAANFNFIFYGFLHANLTLSGEAEITADGLLRLTNFTKTALGHAFLPLPLALNPNSSFSSTFVFGIVPVHPDTSGHGIAFALAPDPVLRDSSPAEYLGLFNSSGVGKASNHIVAVELDTVRNLDFEDVDGNHVGIDVNDVRSIASRPASYLDDITEEEKSINLIGAEPIQVWVTYDGREMRMKVTIAPTSSGKEPRTPLLSAPVNVNAIVAEKTFLGFSASTGGGTGSQYILGWTFALDGPAPPLDLSKLPPLPIPPSPKNRASLIRAVVSSLSAAVFLLASSLGFLAFCKRRGRFAEILEDWEAEYGPHRFSYRDLHKATGGFGNDHFIGVGGFGKVYRGVLPTSKVEVAVKRISRDSRQGMREFVAEIASMGRVRHRNLVQLLGYCRREGELLLVYDYMPNGSLDRYIYGGGGEGQRFYVLDWKQRLHVIKGVAAGLLYLHEEWEQVVIHRDIKAGNVLLDKDFNGRLGDFGLARLFDHGANPQTTRIVGTIGYLAPELVKTGKATTSSDVYAFGAFLLEVACGRPPMDVGVVEGQELVEWTLECWKQGGILKVVDRKLGGEYDAVEMELILRLGLLCSHPDPQVRPSMRQVVQFLEGEAALPAEASPERLRACSMAMRRSEGFDEFVMSSPLTTMTFTSGESSAGAYGGESLSCIGRQRRNDEELLLSRE